MYRLTSDIFTQAANEVQELKTGLRTNRKRERGFHHASKKVLVSKAHNNLELPSSVAYVSRPGVMRLYVEELKTKLTLTKP